MFRFAKFAWSLLMVFSLFGAVATSSVQASNVHFNTSGFSSVEHFDHYHVYYGTCVHSMQLYGMYDCPVEAQQVAQQLRWSGYTVRVSAH